jgi:hypothetical protein
VEGSTGKGGEMSDAKFLRQCGIEIDIRWLLGFMSQDERAGMCSQAKFLLKIADELSRVPSPSRSQVKLLR